MNKLVELFVTFFKIGLFTFGGGYAMISIIEDNCVEQKEWITHDEMMNVTVIAESTPGPIAINCATFVGYKVAGMMGAVFATFGVVLPSFVIILIIFNHSRKHKHNNNLVKMIFFYSIFHPKNAKNRTKSEQK